MGFSEYSRNLTAVVGAEVVDGAKVVGGAKVVAANAMGVVEIAATKNEAH